MASLDKRGFAAVIKELLNHAEWYPHDTAFELTRHGEFMYLTFAWQAYYFDDDIEPQSILVPEKAWANFVACVRDLSNGKLRFTRLSQVIPSVVHENLTYPDPISEDALDECVENVHEILERHLQKESAVIVPLYNLRAVGADSHRICIPLANSTLYLQGSSILHGEVPGGNERKKDVDRVRDSAVLRILVSGDIESQRALALQEANEALRVLRFVKRWSIKAVNEPPYFNPASFVSTWRPKAQLLVYFNPEAEVRVLKTGLYAHDSATINSDDLDYALRFCGLDDINYHYGNEGHPISDQIVRALTLYDKGVLANTRWEALYNFVVCVNVAVLSGTRNKQHMRKDVETLIRQGKGYNRSHYLDSQLQKSEIKTWEELVTEKARPFEKFYRIRSIVTHGGKFNVNSISETMVLQAREIAHNAVRLAAKLAKENGWKDNGEAKAWFESKRV